MSDNEEPLGYDQVVQRIGQLGEALSHYPDPKVAEMAGELLGLVDGFHRDGLDRLVGMIRQWRGEIFFEAVTRDPVTGTLLAASPLPM